MVTECKMVQNCKGSTLGGAIEQENVGAFLTAEHPARATQGLAEHPAKATQGASTPGCERPQGASTPGCERPQGASTPHLGSHVLDCQNLGILIL